MFVYSSELLAENKLKKERERERESVRELPAFVGERDPAVCANLMDRNWGMVNYSTAF